MADEGAGTAADAKRAAPLPSTTRRRLFQLRVVTAATGGAIRAAFGRLRRGPTLPSWPWSLELLVGAFRASSFAAFTRSVACFFSSLVASSPSDFRAATA